MTKNEVTASGLAAMIIVFSFIKNDWEIDPHRVGRCVAGFLNDWRESGLELEAFCWAMGIETAQVCELFGVKSFADLLEDE